MADTIREKIIVEIVSGLEAYGDFSALGSPSIHRGVRFFNPNVDPPPLITILPRPEFSQDRLYGGDEKRMQVDFSALVPLDGANPSVVGEAVLGELITSVFSIETQYAKDFVYKSGGMEYPEEEKADVIEVGISIEVEYSTEIGNPFNIV